MAINRPDEYQHQNPDLAIADSRNVRGGRRAAADRAALYALASKADQLKENVTIVRILSDGENGGGVTEVLLVDDASIGSPAGWELYNTGSTTPGTGGGVLPNEEPFDFYIEAGGAVTHTLPAGTLRVAHPLQFQDPKGETQPADTPRTVRNLLRNHWSFDPSTLVLTISTAAGLEAKGDVAGVRLYGNPGGAGGRDYNNVQQSARDAVRAAGHTWSAGDLLSYASPAQQTAATTGVVKGDYFDAYESGNQTSAYRYTYCLQNDGSLGWTRIPKAI